MGYTLTEVSGDATGGPNAWSFTLDLKDPSASTVSGDFSMTSAVFGSRESSTPYVFNVDSGGAFGSLTSTNTSTGTYTFTVDRRAVIDSGTDQVFSFSVTGTDNGNTFTDTVSVNILICVARGTMIETDRGEVAVERLRVGDRVRTQDGGFTELRWIGSRRISRTELNADDSLRPIRILQDAFGSKQPRRDLYVSPNHRVFVSDWRAELMFGEAEVLVPAKALVNDLTIRPDEGAVTVEYFHILFDSHEIIFTEGLPTESFHPGAYSMSELDNDVRAELLRLFPQLQDPEGYGETARIALRPWETRVMMADEEANELIEQRAAS